MNGQQRALVNNKRVIGIFAHVDAGKTTTSEGILYHTGRIHRMGNVDDGDTQLDWMPQERERGITVSSAATTCQWRNHQVNLIDTPGHIDFSAEVLRSMRVIDGAVIVLCGVGGVEPQTETVWMHADRGNLPRIIFVNKLDRSDADFDQVLRAVRKQITARAVTLQIPVGSNGDFAGMIDLFTRRALMRRDGQDDLAVEPVPASLEEAVEAARNTMLDAVCETDGALLEKRLAGEEPDELEFRAALRTATIAGSVVPVLCGSSIERIGLQPLLDAIVWYLPSPYDAPPVRGRAPGTEEEAVRSATDPQAPFCAAAFKIVADPHVGRLTWVRVYSGSRNVGEMVYNPRTRVRERLGRIYEMHANLREQVDTMTVGDVVGVVGVKSAATGDTICDPDAPIELETSGFPEPVIMIAIKACSESEDDKLRRAIGRLCEEDPTLITKYDPQTAEQTLAGMGELHLDIAVDRMRTEFGIVAQVSKPEVSYRETVRRTNEATAIYQKQTGGHGHYAHVRLRVERMERGGGVVFDDATSEHRGSSSGSTRHSVIPPDFVRQIELGVRETLEKGIIAGYQVTDVRVTVLAGRMHEVDSSAQDFRIAGGMAVRQVVRGARPALIEPIVRADVNVLEEHMGIVTADLARRRGNIKGVDAHGKLYRVVGEAPLAEMRGYATDLRSMTHGRAAFTLAFQRYDIVPDEITADVIAERLAAGKFPVR